MNNKPNIFRYKNIYNNYRNKINPTEDLIHLIEDNLYVIKEILKKNDENNYILSLLCCKVYPITNQL